jgi:hypothetical protein
MGIKQPTAKKFWRWKNQSDEPEAERVLELYGTIAEETWFEDDVTPALFKEELMSGSGPVTIWINSPGGDCVAASQIYGMLMDYKGNITVKIDGGGGVSGFRYRNGGYRGAYGTYRADDDSQSRYFGDRRHRGNAKGDRHALGSQGEHHQRL